MEINRESSSLFELNELHYFQTLVNGQMASQTILRIFGTPD